MRSFRARLLAFVTALAVLVPVGAFARAEYYCRMMGRTVSTCCCGSKERASAPSGQKQLRAEDCCQRIQRSTRDASPGVLEASPPVPPAILAAILPVPIFLALPEAAAAGSTARARAPPALGPPLYIAHCSLLS